MYRIPQAPIDRFGTFPLVLDYQLASQFLGVSVKLLESAVRNHDIPFKRLGSRVLFSQAALLKWLQDSNDEDEGDREDF